MCAITKWGVGIFSLSIKTMFGTEFLWQAPALGTWTAHISLKIARYLSENLLARTPNLALAPKNPLSQTWSKGSGSRLIYSP
jgi:hypothetical protein